MKVSVILLAIALSGCAANRTTIQSAWADTQYAGPPLDRVAVVARFETRADSLAFERNAVEYLEAEGVTTVPAHEILAPEEMQRLAEDEVRARLASTDVDGVLIFRLVGVDARREYRVPTPYLLNGTPEHRDAPPSNEPSSLSFPAPLPNVARPADDTPGYWIEETFLIAETALFDNRTDRLVWTGKSATLDDAHFERASESIVRSVARRLFAKDLISRMDAASRSAPRAERG